MRVSLLKRAALLVAVGLVASPLSLAQNTYSSTPNCPIISNGGPCIDVITVPGTDTGSASDVNVVLYIDHTWAGDLDVVLTHPLGPTATLMDDTCTSDDASSANPLTFDDGAGPVDCSGTGTDPIPSASYDPVTPLNVFNAPAVGDWTISVDDIVGGDDGVFVQWDLVIDGILPVELVSFTSQVNGTSVALNWETASETNNAGFEVQMLRGEGWDVLGFVEGNGTTTEAQTYSYNAGDMAVGTHTFRLKQIDFDGAFEYSDEVEATIETPGSHLISNAYPNPFNPQSQFTLAVAQEQQVTAELFNTLGQRVAVLFQGTVEANQAQLVTIDGAGLASGMYVVRVNGERFSDALSVTLLK